MTKRTDTRELARLRAENVRLFNETKEALERQTATSAILQIISRSPSDVQPALNALASFAVELCQASAAFVYAIEGSETLVAFHGDESYRDVERAQDGHSVRSGRARIQRRILTGKRTVHVPDTSLDPEFAEEDKRGAVGFHAFLGTPMVHGEKVIGTIQLCRLDPGPFSENQIGLLEAFAAQAVIAIENVRLFNETKEALEHQTAIADVLQVISRSTSDLGPVFDTTMRHAATLCEADAGYFYLLKSPTEAHTVASYGVPLELGGPVQQPAGDRRNVGWRVYDTGRTVEIPDLDADEHLRDLALYTEGGFRSILGVPVLKDGAVIGVITLWRKRAGSFRRRQIELVETFANQAIIAIENVRLFNETNEALDQQTAVSAVLQSISRSAYDLEGVLDTVVQNAGRLGGADIAWMGRKDGDMLRAGARYGRTPQLLEALNAVAPRAVGTPVGHNPRAIMSVAFREAHTINLPDITADKQLSESMMARAAGARSVLAVPMLSSGAAVGVIVLGRLDVRAFTDREVKLVETFADQAVIAIENVRLFNETKAALDQQTATSEVLRTISRAAFDLDAVLQTIVERATVLGSADGSTIFLREGNEFVAAADQATPGSGALIQIGSRTPIDDRTLVGRALRTGRTHYAGDVSEQPELPQGGTRTRLAVPFLRDGVAVGALVAWRIEARPFSQQELRLLDIFADQAGIALENVRLFNEIQDKSRQLEAASRHKSEFMANMSHELRTPLNAIIGFSDVLEQRLFGELNDKQADYTRDIATSGRHLLDLVNEILDLSKVEAGRMELDRSEFALADTIRGALAFVRERAASHRVALTADIPNDLGTVVADERKVRQVLLNLLSNAVKFTPDEGTISVQAHRGDGEVQVAVRDTGIGIAPEDQAKVFDEFQQVGKATDRSREGTGLGLTLAKRFIELHGGRIWIDSEVGKGTTFTFALPLGRTAIPN